MKIDKTRFSFIDEQNPLFIHKILKGLNNVMEIIVEAKTYELDWDHILAEYDSYGTGDVCDFSFNYSLGWHLLNYKASDGISKQEMYNDIIDGIILRRENVK
ncbi:MAG: hypothetical protein NWQ38_14960 [Cellulophaga sp.]|nr:hypothetical protein [Cellulophaga sp.]